MVEQKFKTRNERALTKLNSAMNAPLPVSIDLPSLQQNLAESKKKRQEQRVKNFSAIEANKKKISALADQSYWDNRIAEIMNENPVIGPRAHVVSKKGDEQAQKQEYREWKMAMLQNELADAKIDDADLSPVKMKRKKRVSVIKKNKEQSSKQHVISEVSRFYKNLAKD